MDPTQLKYFKLLMEGSGNPKINPDKRAQGVYKRILGEISRYENFSCQYNQKKILGKDHEYAGFIDFDYNLNGKNSIAQNIINANSALESVISPQTLDLLLKKNAVILNDNVIVPKASKTYINLHGINNSLCEKITLYDQSLYNDVWILYKKNMEALDNHQNKIIQEYLDCIETKLKKNISLENSEYESLLNIMDILKKNNGGGSVRAKNNPVKETPLKEK